MLFINRQRKRMAVLLVAPETGQLPDEMGPLAEFISGKSGGLGDVISALSDGLISNGIECHLATLNLSKRFQHENKLMDHDWNQIVNTIDPDHIHLVNSAFFEDLHDAYGGNAITNAAEFQKALVNQIIPQIRAKNGGHLIIHSHDWMAGGIVTAYAKMQGCPILHTVHNVHTGHIPLDQLSSVGIGKLSPYLYFSQEWGKDTVDSQATAIKNATLVNFVGAMFLQEVINGYFSDRYVVPPSVREEVRIKYHYGSMRTVLNAPAKTMYPENCEFLVRNYGLKDNIIAAKRENLIAFQKRTGLEVNPQAILLYWPSRLDPSQKGIGLLEAIAQHFVIAHPDVQIAIIGNGVGNDRTHEDICGRIALSSGGKITYQRFNESLSMLGFAAASDVFGASLYEPCGQIDQVGNLFGATATNRDTGGYHDKIQEISLKKNGTTKGIGNGFLFRDYDTGGLWYGLTKTVDFHRRPLDVREKQIKRIMKEARHSHDLSRMVDSYITIYEQLANGVPLRPLEEEAAVEPAQPQGSKLGRALNLKPSLKYPVARRRTAVVA